MPAILLVFVAIAIATGGFGADSASDSRANIDLPPGYVELPKKHTTPTIGADGTTSVRMQEAYKNLHCGARIQEKIGDDGKKIVIINFVALDTGQWQIHFATMTQDAITGDYKIEVWKKPLGEGFFGGGPLQPANIAGGCNTRGQGIPTNTSRVLEMLITRSGIELDRLARVR